LFYALFVFKCVLPAGDNPIAVNKYIISLGVLVCVSCYYEHKGEFTPPRKFPLFIDNVFTVQC